MLAITFANCLLRHKADAQDFATGGNLSEVFLSCRLVKIGQMVIFVGMGWASAFDFASLRAVLPEAGLWWLTAGGLAYTGGIIFYVLDLLNRLTHAHGTWHIFVLAGSACHFVSAIGYVR